MKLRLLLVLLTACSVPRSGIGPDSMRRDGCIPTGEATDVCNGVDDDCDMMFDEDEPTRPCMGGAFGDRCVNPCSDGSFGTCIHLDGLTEDQCDNAIDDDCDGAVDEGCECDTGATRSCGCEGTQSCVAMAWGPCAGERTPMDELCNTMDDDCDGLVDEDPTDGLSLFIDRDGDGFGDPATPMNTCDPVPGYADNDGDCDDANGAINPSGTEVCGGGDEDCNGMVDDGVGDTYYPDADGDGFGDRSSPVMACTMPAGHVTDGTDCDDGCQLCWPGFPTDLCDDGADNDCNGSTDDSCKCDYRTDSGRVYVVCLGNHTYNEGTALCDEMGMDLADITDSDEMDDVWAILDPYDVGFWIGGSDSDTEGVWEWRDGTEFARECSTGGSCNCTTYCNWRSGQPNGGGSQDCLNVPRRLGGVWEDKRCGEDHDVICELF